MITKRVNVNVPITEYDLEDVFKNIVYNNHSEDWAFEDTSGKFMVQINFMSEDELEQKEKEDGNK